jgi:hypothetical protein
MDYATITSTGPDGHYTSRFAHAFQAAVVLNEGVIHGYALSPGTEVQATVWNGVAQISTESIMSGPTGYYALRFPDPLVPGQRVVVTAGLTADFTLPNLTIHTDAANNRIYGSAPASEPLAFGLFQQETCWKGTNCWNETSGFTSAGAGGSYSASFDNLYFYNTETNLCSGAQVDGQCAQPYLIYYRPDGHSIEVDGPQPLPVAADALENDDTSATSQPYTGASVHTFHSSSDEDWISLTITSDQVGRQFELATAELGETADTVLELYAADGSTLVASDDDSGPGYASFLVWKPSAAGTYYVLIKPYDADSNAGSCGASYSFVASDLFVTGHARVYLPIVGR